MAPKQTAKSQPKERPAYRYVTPDNPSGRVGLNWHERPHLAPQAQRACYCGAKVGELCNGTIGDFHLAR